MKIYITRHGKTLWNEEGRLQGFLDSNLTQDGINMAKNLSKKIKDYDIDLIVSSDLKRAVDTCLYIKSDTNIPTIYFKELREMSFGLWDGMKLSDIYANYKDEFEKFEKDPLNYDNKSGETYQDLMYRVSKAIDEIKKLPHKNILIVTHGITVKAIQVIFEKLNIENISKLPVIKGCSLIAYELKKDNAIKILEEKQYDFVPK